jgi:hypothetical protein
MWRELVTSLVNSPQYEGIPLEFREPAVIEGIISAEERLGVRFPDDLRSLLSETNGVYERWGDGSNREFVPLYSVKRIEEINHYYRTDEFCAMNYMPFENLLFFAEPGVDGVRFAFPITASGKHRNDVFVWWPQDDTRKRVASSLSDFLTDYLMGQLDY